MEEPEWVRLTELLDGCGRIEGELKVTSFAVIEAAIGKAMSESAFTRMVLSAHGEVLDVGRATRSWPDAIAIAIRLRDRHCTFPGCDRPASWNDVHHCLDWNVGGETKITNGCLLFRWHHSYVHAKRWTVRLDQSQKTIFKRPDGTVHQHEPQWPRPSPPEPPRRC